MPPRKRCSFAPRAQLCLRRAVVSRRGCGGADGGAPVSRRGRRDERRPVHPRRNMAALRRRPARPRRETGAAAGRIVCTRRVFAASQEGASPLGAFSRQRRRRPPPRPRPSAAVPCSFSSPAHSRSTHPQPCHPMQIQSEQASDNGKIAVRFVSKFFRFFQLNGLNLCNVAIWTYCSHIAQRSPSSARRRPVGPLRASGAATREFPRTHRAPPTLRSFSPAFPALPDLRNQLRFLLPASGDEAESLE